MPLDDGKTDMVIGTEVTSTNNAMLASSMKKGSGENANGLDAADNSGPKDKDDDCSDLTDKDNMGPVEQAPRSFPQKLMDILSEESNHDVINWLAHGNGFIIHKKKTFAQEIMPKVFKASKFTSFTRKLNRWGFNRIPRGPETGAYFHKLFRRDQPELCLQMTSNSGNKYQTAPHMQQQLLPNVSGMIQGPSPYAIPSFFPFMGPPPSPMIPNLTSQQQQAMWQQQMQSMMQFQHIQMMQLQQQQQQLQQQQVPGGQQQKFPHPANPTLPIQPTMGHPMFPASLPQQMSSHVAQPIPFMALPPFNGAPVAGAPTSAHFSIQAAPMPAGALNAAGMGSNIMPMLKTEDAMASSFPRTEDPSAPTGGDTMLSPPQSALTPNITEIAVSSTAGPDDFVVIKNEDV